MASNFDDIMSATIVDWIIKQPVIQTLDNTPFLNKLKSLNKIVMKEYTSEYKEYVLGGYAKASFVGDDNKINTVYNKSPFTPKFIMKKLMATIQFNPDLVQNKSSSNIVIDEVKTKLGAGVGALVSTIEASLYGSESEDSGNSISGLTDAISKTPTVGTYAGIDRALFPDWRNIAIQSNLANQTNLDPNIFDGTATTASNILPRISAVLGALEYNGAYSKRFILASADFYTMIYKAMADTGRNIFNKSATLFFGANKLLMNGDVEIINAGGLKYSTGNTHMGIDPKTLYIISEDTISFNYANSSINELRNIIKASNAYKASEINLDQNIMLFSVPGIENNDTWWRRTEGFHSYSTDIMCYGFLECTNPSVNAVMFDKVTS